MQWQLSARLTSLIVLVVVSLAVGGIALGLALARGESTESARELAGRMDKSGSHSKSKAESRAHGTVDGKRDADRGWHSKRKRVTDHFKHGKYADDRYHHWWGSHRVIVVPRTKGSPHSFFRDGHQSKRRFEGAQPERQVVRPGGTVIAVGEITAVHNGFIEMFTVLGNRVSIDISRLEEAVDPEVGAAAVVFAERSGDGYVAQSLDLLDVRLTEMLEDTRARSRSGS
jgi:hypothetical protein